MRRKATRMRRVRRGPSEWLERFGKAQLTLAFSLSFRIVEAMRPFFDALGLTQASAKHNDTQQSSTQHRTALVGASSSPPATQRDVPYVRVSMGMRSSCERLLSAMFCDDARAALSGRRVCETPIALDLVLYGTFGGGPSEGEDEEARIVYCGLGEDWQESKQRERGVKRTWGRA